MKTPQSRFDDLAKKQLKNNEKLPRVLQNKMAEMRNLPVPFPELSAQSVEKSASIDPTPPTEEERKHLPMSSKVKTPAPNVVLRSALFGIVGKGSRKYEKNVIKAALNGYTVKFTGEQLDQSDLDVWLECIRLSQQAPLGDTVRFSSNSFLKSIGRNTGKSDHEWLKTVFLRLRANAIDISDGRYSYIGGLVNELYRDEKTGENCLVLNPKIAACFGEDGWTGIDNAIRLELKGKPLTQWLHGFYSTHHTPLPIKVSTIKELCGSEVNELYKFRQMLKKSLIELSEVTGWICEIDCRDLVTVKKGNAKK
ncbi:plasmid replication initiator TrfA (plasmid) [Pantoea agglomerans]|uniref:plasmid replication initiator TrfA n=1 Tax=Enterobacter agglomerans TaxID=549 RepID=UPI00177FAD65|nr:plasmid replication initiator TrfA [Pantoea agglomerans]MBD8234733.1 Replication initiator protein A [Pantoea agglomerans]WVL83409.1 plasmid replication initiator TrfA [Pantoea agglomerans]WVL83433.1 plasmid replication initiator TrfA [Pantoea agglomerans]